MDDIDSIVCCIELGVEDYLFKFFNFILFKVRINVCLEKKWFRD